MNNASTISTAAGDLRDGESISEAVVEAVADEKGVSPTDLRPPLYAVVDPDALDELVASMNRMPDDSPGRVTFPYCEYEVSVAADGGVSVAETRSRDSRETTGVRRTSGEKRTRDDGTSR